jgi:DNA-binding HxlR family transcriptional regulator
VGQKVHNGNSGQRTLYPQVPPKVEYRLTPWGQKLCPALDALLKWAALREEARKQKESAEGKGDSNYA